MIFGVFCLHFGVHLGVVHDELRDDVGAAQRQIRHCDVVQVDSHLLF